MLPQLACSTLNNIEGIGLHHAGLQEGDRKIVEALFCEQKILVWIHIVPAHILLNLSADSDRYCDAGMGCQFSGTFSCCQGDRVL